MRDEKLYAIAGGRRAGKTLTKFQWLRMHRTSVLAEQEAKERTANAVKRIEAELQRTPFLTEVPADA
jgi:hypothetical protein